MNTAATTPSSVQDQADGLPPTTPFASDGFARAGDTGGPSPGSSVRFELDTPFLSEYGLDRTMTLGGPRAELFATLMTELHDSSFEAAVTDLVHEAAALAQDRFAFESADALSERREAVRGLNDLFEPLARESEYAIDGLAAHVGEADLATLSEAELDRFLDRFSPEPAPLPPAFEDFLKSLVNKAKGVVKGAVKLAKKGVQIASKLSPVHLLLGRLKALVGPLLERVLRFAIDKLPVALQPVARQLAKRYLRAGELEAFDEEEAGEQAAADPAVITREVDAKLAGYVLDGEDADRNGVEHLAAEEDASAIDAWHQLQRARSRFAREIAELEPEADPTPVVEQFVQAVLAGLKVGISVLGRPRVVNFLARLIAKLIGRFVGQANAQPLARAMVDAGLRLAGLEAPIETAGLAGETVAATVEDAVNRVVQTAPEAAWQSEALLESYVRDAVARAAAAHFPDTLIRDELHEAADTSGAWLLMPQGSGAKLYKKYNRVIEVALTPQLANAVTTFGAVPLRSVLRDQLGATAQRPVRARAHLYEVVSGTTVAAIAANEKGVRGLGHAGRGAWSLLHPLTSAAAAALLKEPALGKDVAGRFLADRNVLEVGQRLYYLELPDGVARQASSKARRHPPRVSATRILVDLPGSALRIRQYYSEADAQALAATVRKRMPAGVVLGALKQGIESRIAAIFSGAPTRALRIVHEAVPVESLLSTKVAMVLRTVGRPLGDAITKWLLEALSRELATRYDALAAEIVRAADADADGLTLTLSLSQPPILGELRALLSGNAAAAARIRAVRQTLPEYTLTVRAGYARG